MDADDGSAPTARRTDTNQPIRARRRALLVLFQADIRRIPATDVLAELDADPDGIQLLDDHDDDCPPGPALLDPFTHTLVEGTTRDREQVDGLIERFARDWTIDRMPVADRCILRLATWELAHEQTPAAVVIDEAVRAARAISTDDSPRWVNGVLESIREHLALEA